MYAQCTRDVACAFGPGTTHKSGPWAVVRTVICDTYNSALVGKLSSVNARGAHHLMIVECIDASTKNARVALGYKALRGTVTRVQ